jgi:DNA-binding NarL/FixJ family response regulator
LNVDPAPELLVELAIEDRPLAIRVAERLGDMPELHIVHRGHEADVTITDAVPELRTDQIVILLSDDPNAGAALGGAVTSILPKSAGRAELRLALAAAVRGLAVAPAGVLAERADCIDSVPLELPALSPRELGVLELLSQGASNKEIARELGISLHTAKFHVASILSKLDASSRTEAVARAVRLGLLML